MSFARRVALTLVLSTVLAMLGAWGGAQYVLHQQSSAPLDHLLHEELHLTPEQQARIAALERDYATRRDALQTELRAANADLAKAIEGRHEYTPQVQAAIDRFHRAMGELQRETILHVLAMRAVLTPEQAARFDQTVSKSLTEADK